MTSFSGIWVPLVTPFHGGAVDFPSLQQLTRRIVDAGVAGLVVCGSTGEAAALSGEEQLAVLDTVLRAAPNCPVVMGLAGNNTTSMLHRLQEIQQRPVRGLLVPPPYYVRPSQAGLLDYYRTLADASAVPLIVYNIPYRTGVNIEPVRLARHVQADELQAARQVFYRLRPVIELLFEEPNPAPLKAALAMMGLVREELRAPMHPASAALKEKLSHALHSLECL